MDPIAAHPPKFMPKERGSLRDAFKTPIWHRVAERGIAFLAMGAILAIALIFLFIGREALPMFWEQEFAEEVVLKELVVPKQWRGYDEPAYVWQPVGEPPKFNIVPLVVGSLKVTLLAMLISIPLGLLSALFVSQYAGKRSREIIKPLVELLAAVPSVVLGFFALMVLATWIQDTFGLAFRLNAITASIALSLTIVPVIFTISEDALQTVPKSLSDAALALGARRHQIALRVVLPAALPGVAAAIILGLGRAVGETMIVLMASGNAALMEPLNPATSVRTMTATIAAELGEVAHGDPHWRVLFFLGLVLFAITFVLNAIGGVVTRRLQRRFTARAR